MSALSSLRIAVSGSEKQLPSSRVAVLVSLGSLPNQRHTNACYGVLIGRLCRGKAEAVKLDVEDADMLVSPHANVMAFWILIVLFALGTAVMLFVLFNLFRESRKNRSRTGY